MYLWAEERAEGMLSPIASLVAIAADSVPPTPCNCQPSRFGEVEEPWRLFASGNGKQTCHQSFRAMPSTQEYCLWTHVKQARCCLGHCSVGVDASAEKQFCFAAFKD